MPKLRRRWSAPAAEDGALPGRGLSAGAARAVLRNALTGAAEQAHDEAGFFVRLREAGVLVRVRFSETNPGQVTGYSVSLPGHDGSDGEPLWYGGGRLSAGLTLPRLRRRWDPSRRSAAEQPGAFRFTAPERDANLHPRGPPGGSPPRNISAGALTVIRRWAPTRRGRHRRCVPRRGAGAAESGTAPRRGQLQPRRPRPPRADPRRHPGGKPAARRGPADGADPQDHRRATTLVTIALIANLIALAIAVAELRDAQQLAAQAAAARTAATHLHAAYGRVRSSVPHPVRAEARPPGA